MNRITRYFEAFFQSSESSGVFLIFSVLISLLLANSSLGLFFDEILHTKVGLYSVSTWINDGLMSIFFLLVGLEIKRELLEGELSNFRTASLPILGAIGGMILPASIYFILNYGSPTQSGWGVPMATDIAFSLAIISLLGKRVPLALRIFLAALAIVDDLGAILVIALFYTENLEWIYLLYSFIVLAFLIALNRFGIKNIWSYLVLGTFLWYFMHHSGIHATISGVILAFTIPTNSSTKIPSPLEVLEQKLHYPVAWFIMPLFALANTNIHFNSEMVDGIFSNFGMGIMLGLILGKPLGIVVMCWIGIKLGISKLPYHSKWQHMLGAGVLAGIGFTMSIFIALLSFRNNVDYQQQAKFVILVTSVLAGTIGYVILKNASNRK